jgi:prefoldin subunit 5
MSDKDTIKHLKAKVKDLEKELEELHRQLDKKTHEALELSEKVCTLIETCKNYKQKHVCDNPEKCWTCKGKRIAQ